MVDFVCFRVEEKYKDRIEVGLLRDFYNSKNQFAISSPVVVPDKKGFVLFICPILLPIGGFVGRIVKDTVAKGFAESFKKAGITIEKVKSSSEIERLYEEKRREELV